MSPELSNFGAGAGDFANMTNLPSFTEHMANQAGQNLEAPPNGEQPPTDGPNSADIPPNGEQSAIPNPSPDLASAQGEQISTEQTLVNQNQTTEVPPMTESTPSTAASETTKNADTAETAKSATEATAETADFSKEELDGIQKYADKLENDAKKDQELADLLHRFIEIASRQHSAVHQASVPNTATETPTSVTSDAPKSPATPEQPAANTKPLDVAAAIAEAINEDVPIPGPATIVTPAAPPDMPLAA